MRDIIKDKKYFDEYIKRQENSLNKRWSKLSNNLIKEERVAIVKNDMAGTYKRWIVAKYSRGDIMNNPEVEALFTQAVDLIYDNWNNGVGKYTYSERGERITLNQYVFSAYLGILELISLGILLDTSETTFSKLIDHVDRDQIKDFLLDFLFCHRQKDRVPINEENYRKFFHINERYGRLKQIIVEENKETAQQELKYFLEKEWYSSFKGTPLYSAHKNVHNIYVGYWCFVAAAIVKIKGLDDSTFKDNQYYPQDLLRE